jgi:hypothetical protein
MIRFVLLKGYAFLYFTFRPFSASFYHLVSGAVINLRAKRTSLFSSQFSPFSLFWHDVCIVLQYETLNFNLRNCYDGNIV